MLNLIACSLLAMGQATAPPSLIGPSGAPAHRFVASLSVDWGGRDERGDIIWARRVSDSYDDFTIAAALIAGAADDEDGPRIFNELGDAAILSGIVTTSLKRITNVPRPGESDNRDSFPSGHASLAFATATVLADEYPTARPIWYLWAASVAASRVALNRHRVIEIVAGAAVGTWAALAVLDTDRSIMKHLTKEFQIGSIEFQFLPRVHPRGITVLEARW